MWMKHSAIAVCFIAAFATSLITSATETPSSSPPTSQPTQPPSREECINRILTNGTGSQSPNTTRRGFIITMKRGHTRSFQERHPDIDPGIQTGESGRALPIIVVDDIQTAAMLCEDPDVENVEVDELVCIDPVSDEPDEPEPTSNRTRRSFDPTELTWNIDRLDQRSLPLDGEFCPATTGTGVDVYILDTGINYNHIVFNGRASFGGYDAINDGRNGGDCQGHGTHCAGLAVGRLTGVAYGARVYSIRVLNCDNAGFFSYVIAGINHVIERARATGRRSVISMSLIGPKTEAVDAAIREAVANDIVVVTAAGNFRRDSCNYSPSSSPDVINVGGTQQAVDDPHPGQHMLYWFNSQSNSPGTNYGRCVHIFAHGQWIRSASHLSNTGRRSLSGTSMSCPTVAGVVATYLQRYPSYTPRQIRDQLIADSTKNAVNMRTYRGGALASVVAQTTPNRFAYTGRCGNIDEDDEPDDTPPPPPPGCLFDDGVVHDHGDIINPNCSTRCTCNRGTWECQLKKCYNDTCQAYTNGHFHTFDGTSYDYKGTCEYVLVKPCNNDNYNIRVVQETVKPGVVEIKRIIVRIPGGDVILQTGRNAALVNGGQLEKYDGNMLSTGEVLVQWIGGNIHATFEDTGIDVFWDGSSGVQVSVQGGLIGSLCGMCGYYNGRSNDDLRLSGTSTTTNDTETFALSWLRGSGNTESNCKPIASNKTCAARPRGRADEACNVLRNAPFDSCHSTVNPESYIANCIDDFCYCSKTSRTERDICACQVITNYVRACAQANLSLNNWVSQTRCGEKTCEGGRVYKECGSRCQLTCSNYESPPECAKDCAEGCFCSDGQVLKDGQCVDTDTCDDPPPCEGTPLPIRRPFYLERFYEVEINDFISDGRRLNAVPSYINPYRDDQDLLFSMVFSRVNNASACVILSSPNTTVSNVTQQRKKIRRTHRIQTASCYLNAENNTRCIAVFCPKEELPNTQCDLHQSYRDYQNELVRRQGRGFKVYQRKIYLDGGSIFVDVCYRKELENQPFSVSLNDQIDLSNLIQTIQRNEQREFYLTDGNARLVGNQVIYSAVFSTVKYGNCDYRVVYNLDAVQLYERERAFAQDGYHITAIIPNTGNLTPQFIAVFWR